MWIEYCKENNIKNQSEFIKKIIRENGKS
jgi:hypothetical protein